MEELVIQSQCESFLLFDISNAQNDVSFLASIRQRKQVWVRYRFLVDRDESPVVNLDLSFIPVFIVSDFNQHWLTLVANHHLVLGSLHRAGKVMLTLHLVDRHVRIPQKAFCCDYFTAAAPAPRTTVTSTALVAATSHTH